MHKFSARKTVYLVSTILLILLMVTAFLNASQSKDAAEVYARQEIIISEAGRQLHRLTRQEIDELPAHDFRETRRTSAGDTNEHVYTGVLLKDIFTEMGLPYQDKDHVIVSAVDGYASTIAIEKIADNDQVYLVFAQDGQPLPGRSDKGDGPYLMIIRHEQFSQNWCKYVVEVNLP